MQNRKPQVVLLSYDINHYYYVFQVQSHCTHLVEHGSQYSWTMSNVLGQRSDYGTVFTLLTAIVDVVTVMMQESAVNQV